MEVAHPTLTAVRHAQPTSLAATRLYLQEFAGRRRVTRRLESFWAKTTGPFLNLGCGMDVRPGWTNTDRYPSGPDVVPMDMGESDWPFKDASFGGILANQVLEHLPTDYNEAGKDRLITALCEASRVLRPGGRMIVGVPTGPWTWSNATHYRGFDTRTLHSLLDQDPHTNDAQGKPDLRIHSLLRLRTLEVGRILNTSYHFPKYLAGWDPNVGRKRWLFHLLQKPNPDEGACRHLKTAPDGPDYERCLNCGGQTRR